MVDVIDCRGNNFKHRISQVDAIMDSFRLLANRKRYYTFITPRSLSIDPAFPDEVPAKLEEMKRHAQRLGYDYKVIVIQNYAISIFAA